jgi:serine/threonine protein kinase
VATLDVYISGNFKIELPSSMDCLRQIVQGLKYIHSEQLIISTDPLLCLKISDFGLSKSISASGSFSMSGMKGSINFMAPAILNFGDHENRRPRATSASDVFSLGCVFYVFLTEGTHPFGEGFFRSTSRQRYLICQVSCLLPAMKNTCLKVNMTELQESASMLGLVTKMIENDAVNRPTMAQVAEDLDGK